MYIHIINVFLGWRGVVGMVDRGAVPHIILAASK